MSVQDPHPLAVDLNHELLGEWIERLHALNYSEFTIRGYRLAAQKLLAAYPGVPLEKFTPEHVERHVYALPVGPRTKASRIGHLGCFFTWLIDHKRLMKENPCARAERPRWKEHQRPAPSFADFEALRRHCRTLEESVFLELCYFTGLRVREVLSLQLRRVDLANRKIYVVKGKGDKDRVVIFPPRVQELLRQFIRSDNPDAWLFPSPRFRGRRRCLEWVGGTLGRLGKEAGLPYRLTTHLLRHGFTRLCKVRGVPLDVAAKLLGHASIVTTSKLYGRLDVSDLQTVYDRLIGGES